MGTTRSHTDGTNRLKGSQWRNRKTGDVYVIVSIARDCTNRRDGELVVVYRREFGANNDWFVRDLDEFYLKFARMV